MKPQLYTISTGRSRTDLHWKADDITWQALTERLSDVRRTNETAAQYAAMSKSARGALKDVGGFVGGCVRGQRKAAGLEYRSLITLDIDYGQSDTPDVVRKALDGYDWLLYSTHSHTAGKPRYRIVLPLDMPCEPEQYAPIARRVAESIGMDLFDDSTYDPVRLMYWPSASCDAPFVFERGEGTPVDTELTLASYADWRDAATWPRSSRETKLESGHGRKQEDPTRKDGIIGAFCRVYSISEAIDTFLPDKYERAGSDARWTYKDGSTVGGAVVYDDKWLYSHHGTDPVCGREVNAFDLVRIHLFGDFDAEAEPETPANRLPSFLKMADFALKDRKVDALRTREKLAEVSEAFGKFADGEDTDSDWVAKLQWHDEKKKDYHLPSPANFGLICRNDPVLKGTGRYNSFTDTPEITRDLPWQKFDPKGHKEWRDTDDFGLAEYLSQTYRLVGQGALVGAHDLVMQQNSYHPVRDYLNSVSWDGKPRLETLISDYLGAADDVLTRAMTRKHFTAAVARVFEPGVKYDYVLTLVGKEAAGKSSLVQLMGREWASDSFTTADIGDKNSMEQLRGAWLIEMPELKDYNKATVESFKAFVSKQADEYRPAYGRKKVNYPRQCVFFATTNNYNFLKGDTGNRRFWLVDVDASLRKYGPVRESLTPDIVDQVWAEAYTYYLDGENLYLEPELEELARTRQAEHDELTADDRIGMIEAYLKTELPATWYAQPKSWRRAYFEGERLAPGTGFKREYICAAEVLTECLGQSNFRRADSREINQLLAKLGLEYAGAVNTADKVYGKQRRFRIPPEFYATIECGAEI